MSSPLSSDGNGLSAPLWLLVMVTLSGTMAMHIFVPALPVAGLALGASASSMQQTITLYVLGLAVGQLIYGPISDAVGRRPALLLGLGIYLSASVVALFATTVDVLAAARLLQALGGAAGLSLGRAIVRDTATPARVTKDLALLNLLSLVGPGLSPIVGAFLASQFGWRSIYVFLVVFGSAALAFSAWRLPETNANMRALRVRSMSSDYARLLFNRRFAGFTLGGACCTTTLFPYLATVAYIVHEKMGLPIHTIGWFAAVTITGAGLGTFFTRRFSGSRPAELFLTVGVGLQIAMALLFLLVYWLGWLNPAWLVGITVTMTMGAGIASPAAMGRAMGVVPSLSGSAAGIYGFNQMAMGALSSFLVGFGRDPVVACAVTQFALALFALGCFRWAKTAATPPAV
ncbi:Bcr/CflA family efflux MFS transporter [Hydrogenophaga sp.]|uniref:Bcr/CflA family efflux MFS transporter n=1 Tax=Hydrogenophaga sp. TaxID=1904254 RepID=UPI0027224AC5|nr:Bcr/CflA family efflux MFS transporter [Hydrogenophaga sp.]MDO9437167.1 Bcr/CflA family efflux MFS transporter [Hydrogenophaga sp.]